MQTSDLLVGRGDCVFVVKKDDLFRYLISLANLYYPLQHSAIPGAQNGLSSASLNRE